jgi:hypothetical protein
VAADRRTISTDAVPKPSLEVRRRRYGDRRWLVRHNDMYEIDEVTDAVWLGCIEGLTIEDIVKRVASGSDMPTARALSATVDVLRRLEWLGWVELDGAADGE